MSDMKASAPVLAETAKVQGGVPMINGKPAIQCPACRAIHLPSDRYHCCTWASDAALLRALQHGTGGSPQDQTHEDRDDG